MLTKQQFRELKEDPLVNDIIIPVLRAKGYKDVLKYHGGSTELGKDIVCWIPDELGARLNIAVVGKAVPITGANTIAMEVASQVMQSYGASFKDKLTGEEQYIGKCYVITNKDISKDARPAIQSIISNMTKSVLANIRYIDGDELWEWYQQYFADQPLWQKLDAMNQELDTVDSHYRLEARLTKAGTEITAVEKYPGASAEKPITMKSTFAFPTDTEEGRALAEGIELLRATGAPVKIPLSYAQDLEIPEFIKKNLPEITKEGFFALKSAPSSKPLLMRFDFTNDHGEQFTLEYVHLKVIQAGQEEVTFTNDEQPISIKVKFIVRPNSRTWTTYFTFQPTPDMNVHQIFLQYEMQGCLSRPYTCRFTHLESGFSGKMSGHPAFTIDTSDQQFFEVIRALNALQIKTGKLVIIPERDLTTEEMQILERVCRIFLTGKLEEEWNSFTVTATNTPKSREDLQKWLDSTEKVLMHQIHTEDVITLFGQEYPLGKTKPIYLEGKLANEQEVREILVSRPESEIQLTFVPNGDATFMKEYLDWLPDAENTV